MNAITVVVDDQQVTLLERALMLYSNQVQAQLRTRRGEILDAELRAKLLRISDLQTVLNSWAQELESTRVIDENPLAKKIHKPTEEWEG